MYLFIYPLDCGEIDVVLLNDTRIQRIEIHDQDILIPQPTFGLKDQTTLVLVPFWLRLLLFAVILELRLLAP